MSRLHRQLAPAPAPRLETHTRLVSSLQQSSARAQLSLGAARVGGSSITITRLLLVTLSGGCGKFGNVEWQ